MRKDNKGMSLIEVLIVIIIIVIISGVVTVGMSSLLSKPADECANKLVSSLQSARVTTMGKQSLTTQFYMEDNCVYMKENITSANGASSTPITRISEKGVVFEYRWSGDTTYNTLGNSGNPLTLEFNRPTGGLKKDAVTGKYCEEIRISKGSKVLTINIAYLTGKVSLQ